MENNIKELQELSEMFSKCSEQTRYEFCMVIVMEWEKKKGKTLNEVMLKAFNEFLKSYNHE